MKNITLILIASIVSVSVSAQSLKRQSEKKPNPYAKVGGGIAAMSIGGACIAGSVALLTSNTLIKDRTPIYILGGAGALIMVVGGVTASVNLNKIGKMNSANSVFRFTGNGFIVRL